MMVITGIAYAGTGDFNKFVSFVGSFCCVPLSFIFPALFHYKAVAETKSQKMIDIGYIGLGIVVMVGVSIDNIISWGS